MIQHQIKVQRGITGGQEKAKKNTHLQKGQKEMESKPDPIDTFEKSERYGNPSNQPKEAKAVYPEMVNIRSVGPMDKNYRRENAKMQLRDILNHYSNLLSSFIEKNGNPGENGTAADLKQGLHAIGSGIEYGTEYSGLSAARAGLSLIPGSSLKIKNQLQKINGKWENQEAADLAAGCKNLQLITGEAVSNYTSQWEDSHWVARNIRLTPIDWQNSPFQHNAILLMRKGGKVNQGLVLDPWKNQSPEVVPYPQWVKQFPKLSYVWIGPKNNVDPGTDYHLYSGNAGLETKSLLFWPINLETTALQYYKGGH